MKILQVIFFAIALSGTCLAEQGADTTAGSYGQNQELSQHDLKKIMKVQVSCKRPGGDELYNIFEQGTSVAGRALDSTRFRVTPEDFESLNQECKTLDASLVAVGIYEGRLFDLYRSKVSNQTWFYAANTLASAVLFGVAYWQESTPGMILSSFQWGGATLVYTGIYDELLELYNEVYGEEG